MGITKEDRTLIYEFQDKYNKGQRISALELTNLYNRVTGKSEKVVNCSTCLRKRLFDLVNILDNVKLKYYKKLTDEDITFLKWTKTLEEDHYPSFERVVEIYNRVFDQNRQTSNCLKCLKIMLSDLYELGNL